MNTNLLTLLGCLGAGERTVMETKEGKYYSIRCKDTSLVPEDARERSIEGRLMFELMGEYPLSPSRVADWNIARKGFNLPEKAIAFHAEDHFISGFGESTWKGIADKAAEGIDGLYWELTTWKGMGFYVKAGYDAIEIGLVFDNKVQALKNARGNN